MGGRVWNSLKWDSSCCEIGLQRTNVPPLPLSHWEQEFDTRNLKHAKVCSFPLKFIFSVSHIFTFVTLWYLL